MAIRWDPKLFQYVDDEAEFPVGNASVRTPGMAGTIVSSLPWATQFGLGAGAMFPNYRDVPYLGRYVQSLAQPQYGRYLTEYPGLSPEARLGADPTAVEPSFAQWMQGIDPRVAPPQPGAAAVPRNAPWGQPTRPPEWDDIIDVARTLNPAYTGPAVGTKGGLEQPVYDRWADILTDPTQTAALTSMATYDPQSASIFGQLRQRGMERAQQRFFTENPGAGGTGWLAHLASEDNPFSRWQVPAAAGTTQMAGQDVAAQAAAAQAQAAATQAATQGQYATTPSAVFNKNYNPFLDPLRKVYGE
jgi:hypothetical protein